MDKFLKPKEGLTILDPVLRDRVPPDGRLVTMSPYWTRRVLDGDMIDVEAEKTKADKGAAAAKPNAKKRAGDTDN